MSATSGPDEQSLGVPSPQALTAAELDVLVERARKRFEGIRFTPTPKAELDGVAATARTLDQCYALLWRQLAALIEHAPGREEFVPDEVSLLTGWSLSRAGAESHVGMAACQLPGLIEAVEDGTFTHEHVRRLVTELDKTSDLTLEQRQAITMICVYRHTGSRPVELAKKVRETIAKVDPVASAARREAATARRHVRSYPISDGQSTLLLTGPTERIAAAAAVIRTKATEAAADGDDETLDQRMFDAAMTLLTGVSDGPLPVDVHVGMVVPYSVSKGGDYELAEIVGHGPVLPSTARELLDQATLVWRIAVDERGHVINVTDPAPGPGVPRRTQQQQERQAVTPSAASARPMDVAGSERAAARDNAWERWVREHEAALLDRPVIHEHLATGSYTVSRRLKRHLEARDRRCTFPGCWRPASMTDKDHAVPWPIGPTDAQNVGCLCRHHHRAKQAVFTLIRLPDHTARWTTRGGHTYDRHPEAF